MNILMICTSYVSGNSCMLNIWISNLRCVAKWNCYFSPCIVKRETLTSCFISEFWVVCYKISIIEFAWQKKKKNQFAILWLMGLKSEQVFHFPAGMRIISFGWLKSEVVLFYGIRFAAWLLFSSRLAKVLNLQMWVPNTLI